MTNEPIPGQAPGETRSEAINRWADEAGLPTLDQLAVASEHDQPIPFPPTCAWFALCDNPATGTLPHPILGDVLVCDRCRAIVTDAREAS